MDSVKAITYYRQAYRRHREAMWLTGPVPRVWYQDCSAIRRRAVEWRDRAGAAREALETWLREHWAAPPEPFLSIARCEQRSDRGLYGVNWQAWSQSYEGAYGFLHSTWDRYKPAGYPASAVDATILQQTNVARILVATFGGYSSWPACHRRLGLPG